jgi:hypothetical protein
LSFEGIIIERIGDFLRGTSELFEIVTINFWDENDRINHHSASSFNFLLILFFKLLFFMDFIPSRFWSHTKENRSLYWDMFELGFCTENFLFIAGDTFPLPCIVTLRAVWLEGRASWQLYWRLSNLFVARYRFSAHDIDQGMLGRAITILRMVVQDCFWWCQCQGLPPIPTVEPGYGTGFIAASFFGVPGRSRQSLLEPTRFKMQMNLSQNNWILRFDSECPNSLALLGLSPEATLLACREFAAPTLLGWSKSDGSSKIDLHELFCPKWCQMKLCYDASISYLNGRLDWNTALNLIMSPVVISRPTLIAGDLLVTAKESMWCLARSVDA